MAKKGSSDNWGLLALLGVVVGAVILHYTQTGRGDENDAPLIPDSLEGKIDRVVAELNTRFGKRWVDAGLDTLMAHLQRTLPPPVVAVANAVFEVEQMSRYVRMSSPQKRQAATSRLLS